MEKPKYRRVLLKISGEALAGDKHFGLDFGVIGQVTDVIKECVEAGVQMGMHETLLAESGRQRYYSDVGNHRSCLLLGGIWNGHYPTETCTYDCRRTGGLQ